MRLERAHLLRVIPQLRALFHSLALDVSGYADAEVVDAMLAACPVVDDHWPSDAQVRMAFRRLTGEA